MCGSCELADYRGSARRGGLVYGRRVHAIACVSSCSAREQGFTFRLATQSSIGVGSIAQQPEQRHAQRVRNARHQHQARFSRPRLIPPI
jgi:hypothetical protein